LGKDAFIRNVLKTERFNSYRFLIPTHTMEWEQIDRILQAESMPPLSHAADPESPVFILCKGTEVAVVAGISTNGILVTLHFLATDRAYSSEACAGVMSHKLQRWMHQQGKSLVFS
jgi:hypothetical protein